MLHHNFVEKTTLCAAFSLGRSLRGVANAPWCRELRGSLKYAGKMLVPAHPFDTGEAHSQATAPPRFSVVASGTLPAELALAKSLVRNQARQRHIHVDADRSIILRRLSPLRDCVLGNVTAFHGVGRCRLNAFLQPSNRPFPELHMHRPSPSQGYTHFGAPRQRYQPRVDLTI